MTKNKVNMCELPPGDEPIVGAILGGLPSRSPLRGSLSRSAPGLDYREASKEYCTSPERTSWCKSQKCDHPAYPRCVKCPHTDKVGLCAHPRMANDLIRLGKAKPWCGPPEVEAWMVGKRGGPKDQFKIIPAEIVVRDDE
jgi:hypothetical protein